MKYLVLLILLSISVLARTQNLSSLSLKKTYNTFEEFKKQNPDLQKDIILMDSEYIKILNDTRTIIKREILRSALPRNLNNFVFSPSRSHFVAFEETENETDYLFFFNADGVLLNRYKVNIYPNIKFSKNGEYITVFNDFGNEILIFDKNGLIVFAGNYHSMIKDRTKVLYHIVVSDNAEQVLINAGNDIYLVDMKSKAQLFNSKSGRILDAIIYKDFIVYKSISKVKDRFDLSVVSKNGSMVDNMTILPGVEIYPSSIIISDGVKAYEYVFK